MSKEPLSEKELKKINELVQDLALKKEYPSTVGHLLRDQYGVKVHKLTKTFPILTQKVEIEKQKNKIDRIKEHLKKNHKDFVSKRALESRQSRLHNLKAYYSKV